MNFKGEKNYIEFRKGGVGWGLGASITKVKYHVTSELSSAT